MTTLHEKILNEFLNSDIKIKSLDSLNEYITFCISNNQNERIINENGYSKTSYHHILPKALFLKFKDLKVNKWNGTHLFYSDHYYVHWLLTEAINDFGQLSAFCKMHSCDTKNGRINESDLIPKKEFQEKMEECRKQQSVLKSTKEWKETVGKISTQKHLNTMLHIEANGKTIRENATDKYKNSMLELQESGLTKREEITLKGAKTRSDEIWKETIGKESAQKQKESKRIKSIIKYGVYDVFDYKDKLIYNNLTIYETKQISQVLCKTCKDKPLGHSNKSKLSLNQYKNLHLIGFYVKNIKINKK